MTHKVNKHLSACDCSVCWAKHYCDALKLFPCPQPLHSTPRPFLLTIGIIRKWGSLLVI